jgi:hypothetical protein
MADTAALDGNTSSNQRPSPSSRPSSRPTANLPQCPPSTTNSVVEPNTNAVVSTSHLQGAAQAQVTSVWERFSHRIKQIDRGTAFISSLMTACFAIPLLWYAVASYTTSQRALSLDAWTATKEFRAECSVLQDAGRELSVACQEAIKHELGPPPSSLWRRTLVHPGCAYRCNVNIWQALDEYMSNTSARTMYTSGSFVALVPAVGLALFRGMTSGFNPWTPRAYRCFSTAVLGSLLVPWLYFTFAELEKSVARSV